MTLTKQITCNVCGKKKQDVNHWWIAKQTVMDFILLPWGSGAVENPIAEHLCGQECVTKAISQWMEERLLPVAE